ncbi:MAG: hypothetical protein JXB88_05665 [Spirochaetales bacterium]|nr:hypothetical protein [Spirochaetales bacterium]
MASILEKLPKNLSTYLNGLMTEEGFTQEDKRDRFVKNWIKKRALFDKIVEHNGFVVTDKIGQESKNTVFIITYSGSLLTISSEKSDKTRDVMYESIKLRQGNYPKTEETSVTIDFPIELNKSVNVNGGKLVKTSPVFSMAIDKEGESTPHAEKRFRLIGEKISNALKLINSAIFSKTDTENLESREDLFNKWVILTWFRIGGFKEEIFLARANLLWIELFDRVYSELTTNIKSGEKQDEAFLDMTNQKFTHYCDVYKWLESEKKDFDIGLMKALEEIPVRDDYQDFVNKALLELYNTYR